MRTCNRVELYQEPSVENVRHLFRVAAGLESQILVEWEILGQVKRAGLKAEDIGLKNLFAQAVAVGARVRRETGISRGNVSIASAAVAQADKLLEEKDKKIVLIGSGKVSRVVLKNLMKRNFSFVLVANRTFAGAKKLAESIGGRAVRFDRLAQEIKDADLVISSTSAPHLILKKDQIGKRIKPLIIIDLAVPWDIDPKVVLVPGVTLLNINDIKEEISANLLERKFEAIKAKEIVDEEVRIFCGKLELAPAAVA